MSTRIGNNGASTSDGTTPSAADNIAMITACSASPPRIDVVDTPTALKTASREYVSGPTCR